MIICGIKKYTKWLDKPAACFIQLSFTHGSTYVIQPFFLIFRKCTVILFGPFSFRLNTDWLTGFNLLIDGRTHL